MRGWIVCALLTGTAARAAEPDPDATKLLAEARAARAVWENFPGFTADLVVNTDGKEVKGKLHVDEAGKVKFEGIGAAESELALPTVKSIVAHRLPLDLKQPTPCRFASDDARHPLGREVVVLSDELHSSYRIRGREIVVVNRVMKDSRFTTTVLESLTNAEGKLLSSSYVVDYWGTANELQKSEAYRQT